MMLPDGSDSPPGTLVYSYVQGIVALLMSLYGVHLQTEEFTRTSLAATAANDMSLEVSQKLSRYDTDGARTVLEARPDQVDGTLMASFGTIVTAMCAFGQYVPISVVKGILDGRINATLGMDLRAAVVTFQDIESFTAICERYRDNPKTIVELVAPVFEAVSNIIMDHHGTIDKYIGDCIMSFWEVGSQPSLALGRRRATTIHDHASLACINAVTALLECLSVQPACDERSPREGPLIRFRSGAHFGETLLGNFGASKRFNFTVIGDVVNTAARIEPLNKEVHSRTLISHDVFREIPQGSTRTTRVRTLRGVPLRGHGGPLADAGELLWLSVRLLVLLILRHWLRLWESVALLRELTLLRRRVKVRVLCLEELSLRLCELGAHVEGPLALRGGLCAHREGRAVAGV